MSEHGGGTCAAAVPGPLPEVGGTAPEVPSGGESEGGITEPLPTEDRVAFALPPDLAIAEDGPDAVLDDPLLEQAVRARTATRPDAANTRWVRGFSMAGINQVPVMAA